MPKQVIFFLKPFCRHYACVQSIIFSVLSSKVSSFWQLFNQIFNIFYNYMDFLLTCHQGMLLEWKRKWNAKENFSMNMESLKHGMVWNGKNFPYFHTFFVFAHLEAVYILSAVNKATFHKTHKMMKKRSCQRSIQMNRIGKKNGK